VRGGSGGGVEKGAKGEGKGGETSTYRFILPDGSMSTVVADTLTAEQVLQQSPGHFPPSPRAAPHASP